MLYFIGAENVEVVSETGGGNLIASVERQN